MSWEVWSHLPEHMDPIIFSIGPLHVRWYGTMYLLAFFVVYLVASYRIKSEKLPYTKEQVADYLIYAILACIICSRIGYILFYEFGYFLDHPLKVLIPFDFATKKFEPLSGLSYHGGVIGIVGVGVIYCRKHRIVFWNFVDLITTGVPLGYTLGRLANFINGELYGRVTTAAWGMYFPMDNTGHLRHPSQLYEAFFEGLVLFAVLWCVRKVKWYDGLVFTVYLIGYGAARFFIEFVRQPDPQLGTVLGPLTMGQVLCLGMIVIGVFILAFKAKTKRQ
ncbi:MAG: prolipoprotein diacylglyceryl transferase [Sedimentisphaerales bacterium]|nr:prolipoprotein diacylglyceryl transferase [Sedimentisphaerales bacterium]